MEITIEKRKDPGEEFLYEVYDFHFKHSIKLLINLSYHKTIIQNFEA